MPDLATTLKQEIRRLARKEVKTQITGAKQAAAQHRREIAELKRQLGLQQKKIALLESLQSKEAAVPQASEQAVDEARFSARSVKAQRKRLKLSAEEFGKLVGVTAQSVYNWEQGKTRPAPSQFAALVAVREIGRREAGRRLELLGGEEQS